MPVIDLIIRIKNGYMARKDVVLIPFSKFKESVLLKLKNLGYVSNYTIEGESKKYLKIELKYENGEPKFTDVKIFSKPGRRWYTSCREIKSVKGGMGHAIFSSSKGIMTDREAKKLQVGGELLFYIW
jgi:small subunit ribosomal protein S8